MLLYDAHAHLADERLYPAVEALIAAAADAGVAGILACAAHPRDWSRIESLSRRAPVLGALGVHPFYADEAPSDVGQRLRQGMGAHQRLAAVGEIGLDFWEGRQNAPRQMDLLAAQLQAAQDLRLPVVLHNRRSWGDFFGLWRASGLHGLRGVCHCFNGSREVARCVLDAGLMVSFCGPLTYPNARRLREAAAYVPLESILTETDCPDLPAWQARGGPSLPQHVRFVVETIAGIRHLPVAAVADQVGDNFRRLFGGAA